ncbi:MAG: tetratricopeptide repeat protein [Bifidobacteriaceae bacterium]|nr:tetratricopeptide repeat protein [Bifidobacteriaceae bacterium]
MSLKHVLEIFIASPGDADVAAKRLEQAVVEWSDELEDVWQVRFKPKHWKGSASRGWDPDGAQGCIDHDVAGDARLVVGVFRGGLGSPWTQPSTGVDYPSGTVYELRNALSRGLPTLVFVARDGADVDGAGPVTRSPELKAGLKELADDGFKCDEWPDLESLAGMLRKSLTHHLKTGLIKVEPLEPLEGGSRLPVTNRDVVGFGQPVDYQPREAVEAAALAHWSGGTADGGRGADRGAPDDAAPGGIGGGGWGEGADAVPAGSGGVRPVTLVSLVGDGGLGKSFVARRFLRDALDPLKGYVADLVVWANGAAPQAVVSAYAEAAEAWGLPVPEEGVGDPAERRARLLLSQLATAAFPWLVVLDDADLPALDKAKLLPPDSPVGRVLATTRRREAVLGRLGAVVEVGLFTPVEAAGLVRASAWGPLAGAADADVAALGEAVGWHPLALGVAVATIEAGHSTVAAWLEAFRAEPLGDALAGPDPHGYPLALDQVWRVALAQAAEGLPAGVAERAAVLAAVLNPAGHPAWLWNHPKIEAWIAGGEPAGEPGGGAKLRRRLGGLPEALARLAERSMVSFDAAPWPKPTVRMHKLAGWAVHKQWLAEDKPARQESLAALRTLLLEALAESQPENVPDAAQNAANAVHLATTSADTTATPAAEAAAAANYRRALSSVRRLGELGRPAEATADQFQALLEDELRVLGADHPDTITTRSNLAFWLGRFGRPAEAAAQFQTLLQDQLRVLGADHPDTLATRSNLASSLGLSGLAAEAVVLFRALLEDKVRLLGSYHPDTLTTRSNLAFWLGESGQPVEAAAQFRALLQDRQCALGADHPDTLDTRSNLAASLGESGRAAGAAARFQALLQDQVRVLGPYHLATLRTRNNLADSLGQSGRVAEAVEELRGLLDDCVRILGDGHPLTGDVRGNLNYWEGRSGSGN